MIKSTIQPGDGLPVLPQLCCHTFNCSWDLPKDRSLHQCSWCCPGYSFRSSNIDSIGKITEIRKRKFCLKAVFIFQGGQLPPCYEQGDVKICPFSFAKFGDVVFDYTQVGNGFGPYTYNGILLKATYSTMIWQYVRQHQQPNGVWNDGPISELPTGDDLRLLAELAKRKRQPTGSCLWNVFHSTSNLFQASTLAAVILNTTDIAGSECDKQVTFMFINTTQTMFCNGWNTNATRQSILYVRDSSNES